jgi:WD40 repeat protein
MLHHGWVLAVAFSPDGRIVLTGSRDGTAQRWEAATGKPLGAPIVHTHEVGVVAFSPDGKLFLIGGNDGMARLWHTATGRPLGCAVSHQGWVRGAVFHADGQHFLTGSLDGTARAWDLPCPLAGDREHLLLWAQVVTGLELDNEGVIRVLSTEDWRERNRRLQESGSPGGPDK